MADSTKTHSLHTSALATPKDQDTSPDVILIFGWWGAQPRHLRKYADAYTKLYPNASQIIVKSNDDLFWSAAGTRRQRLVPVIDVLNALHRLPSSPSPQRRPRILTHVFSNGGSLQVMLLRYMLQRTSYSSTLVQESFTSALVFDSTPSVDILESFTLAIHDVFQNPIFKLMVLISVYVTRLLGRLSVVIGEPVMSGENLYVGLQDPHILPWMGLHTPRLYLYSRLDKVVPWQDTARHADIAEQCGIDVRRELFEETEHVGHMRGEPERYWSSIQEVWGLAISKEKGEDQTI